MAAVNNYHQEAENELNGEIYEDVLNEKQFVNPNVSEITSVDSVQNNEPNIFDSTNHRPGIKQSRLKKRLIIDESDSEEEIPDLITNECDKENLTETIEGPTEKTRKRLAIVDSDSDKETETITAHNKSFSDDITNSNEHPVFTTNSEGKLVPENAHKQVTTTTILSSLCDPESSEDDVTRDVINEECENEERTDDYGNIQKAAKKKQKPKKKVEKPKKMTGKEAAEQRREIKSESQRMVREKNVSLPYHKPKSYTLKEFLSRRPKFSSAVPIATKAPPSVAIKMSTEQLTLVSKKLKEREKEVKQFYKSESESEDDGNDKDYVPPSEIDAEQNPKLTDAKTDNIGDSMSAENKVQGDTTQITLSESAASKENRTDNGITEEEKISSNGKHADEDNLMDCDDYGGNHVDDNSILAPEIAEKELEPNDEVENQFETDCDVIDNSNKDESLHKNLNSHSECIENSESTKASEISKINGQSSMEYDFNLDGLEENSENLTEQEKPSETKSGFEYDDLDKEIESFGTAENKESMVKSKNISKLELIKEHIANIQPKLTGNPDDVIDLETGIAKPNEVSKLMERFVEHNYKKPTHKNKVQLSIVSIESGEIHKETVAMKLDDEDEAMVIEEKPGAKLQKLRGELQNQIAQKRSELWQKKSTKDPDDEEKSVYEGEKEDCGLDDDILDDEEEMEMSESSEEENEETDCVNEEVKEKSVFIDEEAEESYEEDEALIEASSDGEEGNDADDEDQIDDLSENEDNEADKTSDNEFDPQPKKKSFKKILKGFIEDSDEEELASELENNKNDEEKTNNLDDDDVVPAHQPQTNQTPIRAKTQNKSDFEFLTPISYITGLQNLNNSTSKNLKDSPVRPAFQNTTEPSPLKEDNWQKSLQKKLFMDTEITDSQVAELCSGKFPETQECIESDHTNIEQATNTPEQFICTSTSTENEELLLELCSGKFPSTAEEAEKRLSDQTPSTQDLVDMCSGAFTGITQSDSKEKCEEINKNPVDTYLLNNANREIKSLDEDQDMIISQLIDEEEMEKFKKRFESPVITNTQRRIVEEFEEDVAGGGVIDSDDDGDVVEVKKKNKKRLMFSDDENSEDEEEEEEVIGLHDDVEDDEDSNIDADNIGYDSEENEIELVNDGAGAKMKPSDFFENEAELSESEWGSADEDEKDLDAMEFEQGDTEKFDEKKIRSDLEKIHMRRLLDDDTREVKLLQEMLLEDGELHGTGRERQFKWKNIDSVVETEEEMKQEDDVYLDEEESEEQWRKRRHEREMFLKEKLKKAVDDDDLLSESQLLKIGQKVLQRSQSNSQSNTPIDKTTAAVPGSPVLKQSFSLLNKRGSFLSRSDQVLQRLAEYNKVTSISVGTATAKNSRNFLFQTISMEETSSSVKEDKKRKATDGTPNAIKRLRLSDNLSPAVKKNPTAKAKLFGNW